MSGAAVAIDFYHSLNIESDFSFKVAFNDVFVFDYITELCDIFLGKILNSGVRVDAGLFKDFVGRLLPIP